IPVTVEPEATARIAELGFQAEVERMLEHAKQTLPNIQRIEVVMNHRYDEDKADGVWIEVWSDHPYDPNEGISEQLRDWFIFSFSPDVRRYLNLSCNLMG